jgi:DNA-binding protein WhiA
MDSFSYELKNEVANIIPKGDEESLSELSAIIKTCGEITKNGNDEQVLIFTEIEQIATLVQSIVKNLYGSDVEKKLSNLSFLKKERYEILIPAQISKQLLLDTEVLQYDEEKYLNFYSGISQYLIDEESKEIAFLRGVFIGSFSCNINLNNNDNVMVYNTKNHSTGYHAEFVFSNEIFAQDFCFLLADFDIISKMIKRKNNFVVYVKGLDMISDLFALVGATKGSLKLQNEGVLRSVRNNINRQNNCINANLTKTVDASVKQMQIIDKIKNTIGIDALDDNLKDVVFLRLANPEESLDALVKLSPKKISKSGLYHRFKKLEEIASKL